MLTLAAASTPILDVAAPLVPTLPFVAMVLCGLLAGCRAASVRALASWVTVAALAGSFLASVVICGNLPETIKEAGDFVYVSVHYFQWINIGSFAADFSFYLDALTVVMLLVVTGIGTLIAIYAAWYMAGDPGYARFFAYIGLFIFAMTCLVMADNLLLLYLGWEGVGAASYLLIGFYYRKPSAVAAAKKAFIVNRVGDLGFALGLMATFVVFGSIQFQEIFPVAHDLVEASESSGFSSAFADAGLGGTVALALAIPFLLMLGAFGKSAQLPLHVWLPDAMEGPTPVSALIHAATMVTAGVYMIARLIVLFQMNEAALVTVAVVGGVTALFAATIALCQYDIKRVWAYSTVSQLGYMFLGVGVLGTVGAVFHLFTHAFFKALLFLTAGTVMHALAGQLDLRKMGGLLKKMPMTGYLMLIGCLALAGVPFTSGFYSKDQILTDALVKYPLLGWLGIATALLTAFYTFRLWFRVFMGETDYQMGREHHGYEVDHATDDHQHAHEPHDPPLWASAPLIVLAIGALLAGVFCHQWMATMIGASSAAVPHSGDHHDAHLLVSIVSGGGAVVMIALAALFHWKRRDLTDRVAKAAAPVIRVLHNKYYVDELYDLAIRKVLRAVSWVAYIFDRLVIDGLVNGVAALPRALASVLRPLQAGALQGYALSMGLGLVVILVLAYLVNHGW